MNPNLVQSVYGSGNSANKFQQGLMKSQMNKQYQKFNLQQQKENNNIQAEEVIVDNGFTKSIYYGNPNFKMVPEVMKHSIVVPNNKPRLETLRGNMFKKSPHLLQGYQRRYCILENRKLYYFKPEKMDLPFGILNFDVLTFEFEESMSGGQVSHFALRPAECNKIFDFKGETDQETKRWANAIKEHLKESLGKKSKKTRLAQIPRFWRHDRLSMQQILDEATNGDIILFRGLDFVSKAQRVFTRSEFDHVAFVFYHQGSLNVMEAVASGVGYFELHNLKIQNWHTFYEKIVLRKLRANKDQAFDALVMKFVEDNMGKEYSCSLAKLTKFTSAIRVPGKEQEEIDKNRTFFCSELVAALYKVLGLLPLQKSSCQYFPGDFSCESNLELLGGAKLSSEYIVDCLDD